MLFTATILYVHIRHTQQIRDEVSFNWKILVNVPY